MKSPLGRVAVHLPTEEKCNKFLKALEDFSDEFEWVGRTKPTKHNDWHTYKKETCICLGYRNGSEFEISLADKQFCEEEDFPIITYEEAMKKLDKKSPKYKKGDRFEIESVDPIIDPHYNSKEDRIEFKIGTKPNNKWSKTTNDEYFLKEYDIGGRSIKIVIRNGKFKSAKFDGVNQGNYTLEDWAFLEKVARKIKQLTK